MTTEVSTTPVTAIDGDQHIGGDLVVAGDITTNGDGTVNGDLIIKGELRADTVPTAFKGLFPSLEALREAYPHVTAGAYALVGRALPAPIYRWDSGTGWKDSGSVGDAVGGEVDLTGYWGKDEGALIAAIDISAGFAVLDTYNAYDKCGIYRLTTYDGVITAGILVVTSDDMGHVIDQWLVGNQIITDGTVGRTHRDGAHTICVRSYGVVSPFVPQGQWSQWRYIAGDPALDVSGITSSIATLQDVVTDHDTQLKSLGEKVGTLESVNPYPAVLDWSGKVVSGVEVIAIGAVGMQGEAVWDDGYHSFLLETTGGTYINEWPGRSVLQDSVCYALSSSVAVAGVIEGVAQFSVLPPPLEWMLSPVTVTADKVYVLMTGTSNDGQLVYTDTPQSAGYLLADNTAYDGASAWVDSSGQPLAGKAYSAPDGRIYTPSYVAGQYRLAEWQAGLKARAVYRGGDGSVWIATSAGCLERIVAPVPDTSPLLLDASLASSWQMAKLPPKAEVIAAWTAGRAIRIDGTPSSVLVGYNASSPGMVQLTVLKWSGMPVIGTVTYSGTADGWGYDAVTYAEHVLATASAQGLKEEA